VRRQPGMPQAREHGLFGLGPLAKERCMAPDIVLQSCILPCKGRRQIDEPPTKNDGLGGDLDTPFWLPRRALLFQKVIEV
jgi:hypothetical protein